jgi:filamentous hemagglutinin family protein
VVTDTTTTQPTSASTTNYVITGGLPTYGNALLHSFSKFDLGPGQTATFDLTSGPSTTNAIWARILSGSQSRLEGTINVHTLFGNNVELTLVNPFGFVLGTGFNTNGVNSLALFAAPQVFVQVNAQTSYLDLLSTATTTTLSTGLRLAGASYSTQAELDQSSIAYGSTSLSVPQLSLMAAKIDFQPGSLLKTDSLRVLAPWFMGGINYGASGTGFGGLLFGTYATDSYAYSFTQDNTFLAASGAADPAHFLLTRDSLYTASSSKLSESGSVYFNGTIMPFSASSLSAFLVARQAYVGLQSTESGFTSPFGDYATTDLSATPPISGNAGFSVRIFVDPSVGLYQPPVPSPTNPAPSPKSSSDSSGNSQSTTQGPSGSFAPGGPAQNVEQGVAVAVAGLPIPQLDNGLPAPGKDKNGSPRPGAVNDPTAKIGSAPSTDIAVSATSVGVATQASSLPTTRRSNAQAGVAATAGLISNPVFQSSPFSSAVSIDTFSAAELTVTHDTAKALGVADAEAMTPAQLQKLLQAAKTSVRQRYVQAKGAGQAKEADGSRDQAAWVAFKPGSSASDAHPSLGLFSGISYNPAILSIRFSEAKGRTVSATADSFLDYTLIPAQGPIIGHRLELAAGRFAGLLKQLYGSISRQEGLDVADGNSPARQLYGLLIAPIADQLQSQKITTVLIAADRGLQGVPFAALHDGQEFFGDRYAFSLTPALSLTDLKLQDGSVKRLLTLGASQFSDGLAPLPLVPQEVEKIAALKTSDAMLNHTFTPKSLLGAASDPRYGWIHVATHAEFLPGGPSHSRLFTGTEPLPLSAFAELRKTRLDHPIDLFTLSACRTALGDADSELGFAGLAIQAGARSAIGTLWYVDDVATSAYFIQLYRYLSLGLPKAEALQATRRDFSRGRVQLVGNKIIAADGESLLDNLSAPQQRRVASGLANPYFWAGIEMVGSPW